MPQTPERHAAYMREWRKRNPHDLETQRAAQRKYQAANLEKVRAHSLVYRATRDGRLIRPDSCSRCGSAGKVEASHTDYALPLDVEWLCRLCHMEKDGLRSQHAE